jgi:hypothetical protein
VLRRLPGRRREGRGRDRPPPRVRPRGVGFTGSSLLCASAGSAELLLGARAAQRTAAALLSPAALALLTASTVARVLGPLLLGAAVLVAVFRRARRRPDPLLPAGLLAVRAVRGANLVAAALTAATTPAMYLAVPYVQDTLRLPPSRAALYFRP